MSGNKSFCSQTPRDSVCVLCIEFFLGLFLTRIVVWRTTCWHLYNCLEIHMVKRLICLGSIPNQRSCPSAKTCQFPTEDAPSMLGKIAFPAICKDGPHCPDLTNYHYINHLQTLGAKVLHFQHVVSMMVNIGNSIRAKTPTATQAIEHSTNSYLHLILNTEIYRVYAWWRWLNWGESLGVFTGTP